MSARAHARDRFAYTHAMVTPGEWSIVICEQGVQGYRLVTEYGPYKVESRAKGVSDRLNSRLGIDERRAHLIIQSTMVTATVRAAR